MANDDSEKRAPLEKADVNEKVIASEQDYTPSADTKDPEVVRAVSRQSTTNKPEPEGGAPASGADSDAAYEERWLTGRKLVLVHTAMLLSSVWLLHLKFAAC
jgi:hypothetical protein